MTLISGVYIGLTILTLVVYLLNYRQGERYWKFMVLYLLLVLITSVAATGVIEWGLTNNNLFIFHIYTPLEYLLLGLLYAYSMENMVIRRIILISIPLFMTVSVWLTAFVQPLSVNNSYSVIIESILIMLWTLVFIRETIMLQRESRLQRFPMFWISIGFLFYFVGGMFVEGLLNYMLNYSMELARQTYKMSFIFKYLLFVLLMVGASCRFLFRQRDEFTIT